MGGVHWKDGWTFATAEECEYPVEMFKAIASRVARHASVDGPSEPPRRRKPKSKPSTWDLHQRAALGRQPRGKRIPAVVSEYREAPEPWSVTDPDDIATVASQPSRLDKDVAIAGRELLKRTKLPTGAHPGKWVLTGAPNTKWTWKSASPGFPMDLSLKP